MSHGFIDDRWEAWKYEPNQKKKEKMWKKMERDRKKWLKIYGYPGGSFDSDFDVQCAAFCWWRKIWPLNYVPIWWF